MNNVDLIQNLYEAFAAGDIPTVLSHMHAEIKWHEAESNVYKPSGEPFTGPDQVLNELFMKLGGEWENFAATPHSWHDAGDTVITEGRYTGAYKETGKSLDAQFCHVWTIHGGKVVKFQQYTDTAAQHEAMGATTSAL